MSSIHSLLDVVDRFLKETGLDLAVAVLVAAVLTGTLKLLLSAL